ncbi:MAG: SMP-30/gluconolactonase/LRE family protein, partial [Actinomycetota bacterium]|nr:SMP-30/gluconolactonase/LRE family protein [Actinomycetota bacterium]
MRRPSIDPGRWRPPKAPPFVGRLETNTRLTVAERWSIPAGRGGEDVALDHEGRVYTGVADGRVLRYPAGGGRAEVVADTGGRPLGIEVDRDGSLVVCDPRRGLLRIDPGSGEVRVLADRYEDEPFQMVNNASIASDGRIYFTDSTSFAYDWWMADVFEHRGNGRLFVHDPA